MHSDSRIGKEGSLDIGWIDSNKEKIGSRTLVISPLRWNNPPKILAWKRGQRWPMIHFSKLPKSFRKLLHHGISIV